MGRGPICHRASQLLYRIVNANALVHSMSLAPSVIQCRELKREFIHTSSFLPHVHDTDMTFIPFRSNVFSHPWSEQSLDLLPFALADLKRHWLFRVFAITGISLSVPAGCVVHNACTDLSAE